MKKDKLGHYVFLKIEKLCILEKMFHKYVGYKIFNLIKSLCNNLFFSKYIIETVLDPESKVVFFLSESSNRNDHTNSYANVRSVVEHKDIIHFIHKQNKIDIIRSLRLIKMISLNLHLEKGISLPEKIIYYNSFICAIDFINEIRKVNIHKYSLGVVYYDVSKADYLFTSYLKSNGIKTATLQHACFIGKRNVKIPNFEFDGIELSNSISDYFLAWNNFTREEALENGMDRDKIVVLGIPKYINRKISECKSKNYKLRNVFGVVLNAKSFDKLNRKLIDYANKLAQVTGSKFYLKYHPQYNDFEYNSLVDTSFFEGNLEFNTSVEDYVKMVDFTLLSNSSVFIELIYLKHKIYRMSIGEEDKFLKVKVNTFDTFESLQKLISKNDDSAIEKLFNYLCHSGNSECEYKEFFLNYDR